MSSYNNNGHQQGSSQQYGEQHHRRRRPNSHNRQQPLNSEGLVQTWPVPGIKIDVSIFLVYLPFFKYTCKA